MTIRQALERAVRHPAPVAWLDAEILLGSVLRRDRTWLLSHDDQRLSLLSARAFARLCDRRRRGTPTAYLTGTKEFFGLSFRVTSAVLIPRPESELLVETALARLPLSSRSLVADIGTGSGCLAVALACHRRHVRVIALDQSAAALAVARANARQHGVAARVDCRRGDLLTPLRRGEHPAIIVANLPYLRVAEARRPALRFEPRAALAAGADGLSHYRRLFAQLASLPERPKIIICEIAPRQAGAFRRFAKALNARVEVLRDLAGKSRVVSLTAG